MKNKWTPHAITAGAFVVFIALGLACSSSPRWANVHYTGETSPLLEGTTWTYIRHDNNYTTTVEFRHGGKLVMSSMSGECTWKREGNTVYMTVSDGWTHYIGTYNQEVQKIWGSAENSEGYKWDWTLEPRGSAVPTPTASAGASQPDSRTVNVTVYYEKDGNRYPVIYTVTASSANEAEEQARRQWQNQFGWDKTAKFISASAAWY